MPFSTIEMIEERVSKSIKTLDIVHIQVITLEVEKEYNISDTTIEIVPFWQWALSF